MDKYLECYMNAKGKGKFGELLYSNKDDVMHARYLMTAKVIDFLLQDHIKGTVLDVGCGSGLLFPYLSKNCGYCGIEPLEHLAVQAEELTKLAVYRLTIDEIKDRETWYYDVVVLCGVLAIYPEDKIIETLHKMFNLCAVGLVVSYPTKGVYKGTCNCFSSNEMQKFMWGFGTDYETFSKEVGDYTIQVFRKSF